MRMHRRIQIEQVQQLLHPRGDALDRPAEQLRHRGDVLGHRTMREQPMTLNHVANAPTQGVRRLHRRQLAIDAHRPSRRLNQAIDHAQQRGLARARPPNNGRDRSARHCQADLIDHGHGAIALGQALDLDHAGLRRSSNSTRASSTTPATRASATVGKAPSRTRSVAVWPIP